MGIRGVEVAGDEHRGGGDVEVCGAEPGFSKMYQYIGSTKKIRIRDEKIFLYYFISEGFPVLRSCNCETSYLKFAY